MSPPQICWILIGQKVLINLQPLHSSTECLADGDRAVSYWCVPFPVWSSVWFPRVTSCKNSCYCVISVQCNITALVVFCASFWLHTWHLFLVLTFPQPGTRMIPQESLKIQSLTGMWQWQTDTTTQKKTWRTVSMKFKNFLYFSLLFVAIINYLLRSRTFNHWLRSRFKVSASAWLIRSITRSLKIAGG